MTLLPLPTHTLLAEAPPASTSPKTKTILTLPIELILSVCDAMSYDAQACLALTCRQLHYYIGQRAFSKLKNQRCERAMFLQRLQKDRPMLDMWLCYSCARLHSTTHRYDPPNFHPVSEQEHQVIGYPYCRSTYAEALDEIHSRLSTQRDEWGEQTTWMEDDVTTPHHLSVYITTLASSTKLFMRRRYTFTVGRKGAEVNCTWPTTLFDILAYLGAANLDICPHICFNTNWQRGDRSIMDVLNNYYELSLWPSDFTMAHKCVVCRLELEVQCTQAKAEVVVLVWQEVGRLLFPDTLNTDGEAETESQQERMSWLRMEERGIMETEGADQTMEPKSLTDSGSTEVQKDILWSSMSQLTTLNNELMKSERADPTTQPKSISLSPSAQVHSGPKTWNVITTVATAKRKIVESLKVGLGFEAKTNPDPALGSDGLDRMRLGKGLRRQWKSLERELKWKEVMGKGSH